MNFREIEKKFYVKDLSQPEVEYLIEQSYPTAARTRGRGTDYYFSPSGNSKFDFIRLRPLSHGYELTGKAKDKGSNIDRLEINLPGASFFHALEFCRSAFGTEIGKVTKTYTNYYCHGTTVVTTYTAEGIPNVIVEGEAAYETAVDALIAPLTLRMTLIPESRSLYEMLVEPKKGLP